MNNTGPITDPSPAPTQWQRKSKVGCTAHSFEIAVNHIYFKKNLDYGCHPYCNFTAK